MLKIRQFHRVMYVRLHEFVSFTIKSIAKKINENERDQIKQFFQCETNSLTYIHYFMKKSEFTSVVSVIRKEWDEKDNKEW